MNDNASLQERLKLARKKSGMTQKELGDKLKVSPSMISQYESGVRFPKVETVERIAGVLGVPLTDLLTVDIITSLSRVIDVTDLEYNDDLYNIDDMEHWFYRLNSEGQKKAIKYAEDLVGNPIYKNPAYKDVDRSTTPTD